MSATVAVQALPHDHPPSSANPLPENLPQPPRIVSENMYKNRLQEHTQKWNYSLPVYTTVNEGAQHAPKFRATVIVNGEQYTSATTFINRKAAEQDVARIALTSVTQEIKDVGRRIISQDTTFCKSIVNEYASKKRMDKPVYYTVHQGAAVPLFVSTLVLNGVSYMGESGRNKKEAEQLVARLAILSLLDSEEAENIYEVIKSKFKLYAALNNIKEASGSLDVNLNKRKQDEITGPHIMLPDSLISDSTLGGPSLVQTSTASFHEFKKPKPDDVFAAMPSPIEFVPVGSQLVLPSTSGVTKRRRMKKKLKKQLQANNQMAADSVSQHQILSCPETQ